MPISVLLIEDDSDDESLVLLALRQNRWAERIDVLRDGAEAAEYIQTTGDPGNGDLPRLVFLDLKLPKVSGLELLRQLKTHPRWQNIPVVVLTSSLREHEVQQAYALGAESYMLKEVDFTNFKRSVNGAADYWLTQNLPAPKSPDSTN